MQGLPPQITGVPPQGSSTLSQASGNPGETANAQAILRQSLHLMQQALPMLQPGKMLDAVLDATKKISGVVSEAEASPGMDQTALQGIAQQQKQMQPYVAMMRGQGMQQGAQ